MWGTVVGLFVGVLNCLTVRLLNCWTFELFNCWTLDCKAVGLFNC